MLWLHEFNNNATGQFSLEITSQPSTSAIVPDDGAWWARNDDVYYTASMMTDTPVSNIMAKLVREKRAPFGNPVKLGEWNGYLEQCSAVAI